MRRVYPDDIDAILPQTQCGLCGHDGCMPYAEAIAYENAPINLCPPGGINTLIKLGTLVKEDPTPYLAEMQAKEKPPLTAVIREDECIGCTKCIAACPVDAILGSAKQMHTIITDECTGCELCIAPCPVDCIELMINTEPQEKADQYRQRFIDRKKRLDRENRAKKLLKASGSKIQKKNYIAEALARAKAKKMLGR